MASPAGQILCMSTLGGSQVFIFSINTVTYDALNRVDEWKWESLPRLLNVPAEQFISYGSTTIDLDGVIYPLRGYTTNGVGNVVGTLQLQALRRLADLRQPYNLTSGSGRNYGFYVILKVTDEQTAILDNGEPRKQAFKIQLRSFRQGRGTGYLSSPPPQAVADSVLGSSFDNIVPGGVIEDNSPPLLTQTNNDAILTGDPPKTASPIGQALSNANTNNGGQFSTSFVTDTNANTMSSILAGQADAAKAKDQARLDEAAGIANSNNVSIGADGKLPTATNGPLGSVPLTTFYPDLASGGYLYGGAD